MADEKFSGGNADRHDGAGVFLSYSRRDQEFVRRLEKSLSEAGRNVWVDWQDIPPTAEWRAEIHTAIGGSGVFVFVMSPASLASEVCREEVRLAVDLHKRLVPIVIDDVDRDTVPAEMAARNWLFFRPADEFESSFAALARALDTDLDWLKAHTRLLVRATEWEAKSNASLLLRGSELEAAEQWLAKQPTNPEPTTTQSGYVLASRRAASRRQRGAVMTSLATLVVMALLASVAWVQRGQARDQARTAQSGELAANARVQLDVDPELSVLLGMKAYETKATPEAGSLLRQAVLDSRVVAAFPLRSNGYSAAFSPDGKRVAIAMGDATIRIWDWESDKEPTILKGHDGIVYDAAFSPDGNRLVTAGFDKTVRVWDLTKGSDPLVFRGHENSVYGVAFSPNGHFVASASADGTARVWDPTNPSLAPVVLRGHEGPVRDIAFSPDSQRIATGSDDTTIRIWSGGDPVVLRGNPSLVTGVAFSANGEELASSSVRDGVRVWDLTKDGGNPVKLSPQRGGSTNVAYNPKGDEIVSGYLNGTVNVWHAGVPIPLRGHKDADISNVSFSPDGRLVVSVGDDSVRIWVWAGRTAPVELQGHQDYANSVAFSPDDKRLVTAGEDATVRIWDLAGTTATQVLKGHEGNVSQAVFSPDGRLVASAGDDRHVRVWDLSGKEQPVVSPAQESEVSAVSFSPDGRRLALGMYGAIGIWDWRSGAAPRLIKMPDELANEKRGIASVSFSPDGRRIVTGTGEGAVRIYPADGNVKPIVLTGHQDRVTWVAFSRDGRRIVSSSGDSTARVWDVDSKKSPVVLRGHQGSVRGAAISPDGQRIATVGEDGTVRIWDSAGLDPPVSLPSLGNNNILVRVAFSHDGRKVAVVGSKGVVQILECVICAPTDKVVSLAKTSVTRGLTADERATFLNGRP